MINNKVYRLFFIVLSLMHSISLCAAEPVSGSWRGTLSVSSSQHIDLIFHIKQEPKGYSATMDVPAQQQFGLPMSSVSYEDNQLSMTMSAAKISYSGTLANGQISGRYQQGAFTVDLVLTPNKQTSKRQPKPQEPQGQLPYSTREVSFDNTAAHVTLSGTLNLPLTPIKATAVLLSGSGPTNRDADVAGHKLFLVLADQLARQGIAVLRYDDRGVGKSTGDFTQATSADFAKDAIAAIQFLKQDRQVGHSKIGFIGHSEGGLIGAIAQAQGADSDFFISMAGPGTAGSQILIDQSHHIQKRMGMPADKLAIDDKHQRQIMTAIHKGGAPQQILALLMKQGNDEAAAKAKTELYFSPWFHYFIQAQPQQFLAKITIPMLAINGELDSQVLPQQNLQGIEKSVPKAYLTTKLYPNLNHLFQPANTGLPNEYMTINTTISEQVIKDMSRWIKALI